MCHVPGSPVFLELCFRTETSFFQHSLIWYFDYLTCLESSINVQLYGYEVTAKAIANNPHFHTHQTI